MTLPVPVEVDAIGLLCPLPILRAQAALARAVGDDHDGHADCRRELVLWADDEGILQDLPRWCEGQGHELLELVTCIHPSGRKAWRGRVRPADGSSFGSTGPRTSIGGLR